MGSLRFLTIIMIMLCLGCSTHHPPKTEYRRSQNTAYRPPYQARVERHTQPRSQETAKLKPAQRKKTQQKKASAAKKSAKAKPVTAKPITARELKKKISSIINLKERIAKKKKEAHRIRKEYRNDIGRYKDEISSEREKTGISSYAGALRNKRIVSNLSLIQRNLAYADKMTELIYRLEMGSEELLYLEREAKIDLEMIKVMDNKNLLLDRINNALRDYRPMAENFAISKDQLKLMPTERIWNDLLSGRL